MCTAVAKFGTASVVFYSSTNFTFAVDKISIVNSTFRRGVRISFRAIASTFLRKCIGLILSVYHTYIVEIVVKITL